MEKQDLTYLNWSKIRNSSGTAGSFLKAYFEEGNRKLYYKLSDYDSTKGVVGHECINEKIVDRLLTVLGIYHLRYELIYADIEVEGRKLETYLCRSEDFKRRGDQKAALDAFYDMEKNEGESRLEFCIRMGWESTIYEMLVVDFLILNRDRHGANIEVIRNPKKKTISLAPLFDHGLSLLSRCRTEEEIEAYDVLDDKPVQCFVGSRSAKENLLIIPADKLPKLNPLKESHKDIIMGDLDDVISEKLYNKIWEMIWKRWCYYEDFCNKRRLQ